MGIRRIVFLWAASAPFFLVQTAIAATPGSSPAQKTSAADIYRSLPLGFEPNEGQAPRGVDFVSRAGGYSIYVSGSQLMVVTAQHGRNSALRIDLVGSDSKPELA